MDFALNLGFGILGGLILNVMPCVFPVLFFKLSRLVEHADEAPGELRRDAFAYLAGTWATFGVFAALIIALKAGGETVGWGMHMQNPTFVAFLVILLFVFGLNALGVFEFRVGFSGDGPTHGWKAAFFDGMLITLVSTPCSAPFLGGAAAAALSADAGWYTTLALFLAIGFGLALPVLVIGLVPGLNRLLPRPGSWMNTFKAVTGFTLIGAALWLFDTLSAQISAEGAQGFLYFLLAIGVLCWAQGHLEELMWTGAKKRIAQLFALGGVIAVAVFFVRFDPPGETIDREAVLAEVRGQIGSSVQDGSIAWTPFDEEIKKTVLAQGRPIFVDFTADWCATCKTFEKTHINTEKVRAVLDRTLILAAKADLTRADNKLWDELARFGRSGLPAYIIYKPDGTTDLLPEGAPLTLIERLEAAAAAFPPEQFRLAAR